ncbi:hypothetical protein C6T53_20690 [Burkholderia multivorans]|nr:hypothetical protein C6T53_20690 [Burkholderia multivorans]
MTAGSLAPVGRARRRAAAGAAAALVAFAGFAVFPPSRRHAVTLSRCHAVPLSRCHAVTLPQLASARCAPPPAAVPIRLPLLISSRCPIASRCRAVRCRP